MRQFFTDCFASLEQQSNSALKGDEVAYWNCFFQGQETGDAHHTHSPLFVNNWRFLI